MIVLFSHPIYIAIETNENVQVCVDVWSYRGEILRPFTIVLLPGEGNALNNVYIISISRRCT